MQTTANLGLKKPEGTDVVNIQDFNDNADLLDNYAATTSILIGAKASIASPALTGTPTAPTAGVDTSTTQVATTAFVLGQAGTTAPVMNGTAGIGSSKRYARADHVHPADTSRAGQVDLVAHLAENATEHATFMTKLTVTGTDLLAWALAQTKSGPFSISPTVTDGVPVVSWYNGSLEVPFAGGVKITLTQRTSPFNMYVNTCSSGNWSGWIKFVKADNAPTLVGENSTFIPTTVNLDSYKTAGNYHYLTNSVDAGSILNIPKSEVFTMQVATPASNAVSQTWRGNNTGTTFYRLCLNDVWQPWKKTLSEADGTWFKIAEQTLATSIAQVDFSSIPSGYRFFKITFETRSTSSSVGVQIRFNDDSSAIYDTQKIELSSVIASTLYSNQSGIFLEDAIPSSGSEFSYAEVVVSNTPIRKKMVNSTYSSLDTMKLAISSWENITNEINKITVKSSHATYIFSAGSTFRLEGCK